MPARSTDLIEFLLMCLTPTDEWESHGGFDNTDDENPEYDGTALGDDDIDGYDEE